MTENAHIATTATPGGRSAYSPPTVTDHGSIAEVTRAQVVGPYTDHAFPANTPTTSLTFSGT
ncbi:MAG: lasso RiPP family leader peptide-containing protein [Acidimicrobiales bacterium]